jgi:hypothetical protein
MGVFIVRTRAATLVMAVLLVTGMLAGVAPDPAFALRCGTKLVSVGDSIDSLYGNCGPPTFKLTPLEQGGETWFYNRGAARFMTKILIFGGKITAIEEEDYGIAGPVIPAF